jgi:hypothetical protein
MPEIAAGSNALDATHELSARPPLAAMNEQRTGRASGRVPKCSRCGLSGHNSKDLA